MAAAVATDEQVALPVPGHEPVENLDGALGDAAHVRDPVAARCQAHPPLRSPADSSGSQLSGQLRAETSFCLTNSEV